MKYRTVLATAGAAFALAAAFPIDVRVFRQDDAERLCSTAGAAVPAGTATATPAIR